LALLRGCCLAVAVLNEDCQLHPWLWRPVTKPQN